MLKIKDNVDLKKLKKFGFKEIQQDKRINYIYMPVKEAWQNSGNSITIYPDRSLFNLEYYEGEDKVIEFEFNEQATYDFRKTIDTLYDLIQAGLVEKVEVNKWYF